MNNERSALEDLKSIVEVIGKLRDTAYAKYSELVGLVLENQITDERHLEQAGRMEHGRVRSRSLHGRAEQMGPALDREL